jgi:gliding motility-associated-like protein
LKQLFAFFSLFLLSSEIYAQKPVAAFLATPSEGCAPLFVRFSQLSSNNPTNYFWDLGNGLTSTIAEPSTTYTIPGVYTVKLIAKNNFGVDSVLKTNFIIVNPNPVVNFKTIDTLGCFPLASKFTDLSTISSGSINAWSWDFGDGILSSQQNPTHVYRLDNIFNVTLKVTSQKGCIGVLSQKAIIEVTPGVVADFKNTFANACKPPSSIEFTNQSTGPGALKYTWKFGDGTQNNTQDAIHSFSKAGTYTVSMLATSSEGCTDSITKDIVIPDVKITTTINAPDTGCIYSNIKITGSSNPNADNSNWNFGDGTFANGQNQVKMFIKPGVFQIKLTNTVGSCLDSAFKKITILDGPTLDFSTTDTIGCQAPFTATFQDKSKDAVSWTWDFGDGTTSTLQNPSKTYTKEGVYSIAHMGYTAYGCGSYIKKDNLVKIVAPTIGNINLPTGGCAPLKVNFNAAVNSIDKVVSYFWDFGKNDTTSLFNPVRTFDTTGTYPVSFTATTQLGCKVSYSANDAIRVGTAPKADFEISTTTLCSSEPVNFKDLSTGNVNGWVWNLGDIGKPGNIAYSQNTSHTYTDTGNYTISLTAYNNGCPNTITKTNILRVNGTTANFEYAVSCVDRKTVNFTNKSLNATTFIWDFGDNTFNSTDINPIHIFPSFGTYNVTLTTFSGGCTSKQSLMVFIVDQKAKFTVKQNILCKNAPIHFTSSSTTTDTQIYKYEWDWGNGNFEQNQIDVDHTFNTNGNFKIVLKISDRNGCYDTVSTKISVGGPNIVFDAPSNSGCAGFTAKFEDHSISDGQNQIVNRNWFFGDGGSINTLDTLIQYKYLQTGFFDVKLIVTDAVGCVDSLTKIGLIAASNPKANFSVYDSISCPGKPIQFISSSSGAITNYNWTLGEGKTSTLKTPTNAYQKTGNYDIQLMITDKYGCKDSLLKPSFIIIDTPIAKINISDSIGNCPPLIVQFRNNSSFYKKIKWEFGDGDIALIDTPSHIYTAPGDYTAKLTVTSPGGCINSTTKSIKVFGPIGSLRFTPTIGCIPTMVNFKLTSNNTDSLIWNFQDGSSIITKDPIISHLYTAATDLQPEVTLQDVKGCRYTLTSTIDTLKIVGFKPDFGVSSNLLCTNGTVDFFDKTYTNGSLQKWNWDFGDGTSGIGSAPTHFYKDTGNYTVKLKVTSQNNCTDSITLQKIIAVVPSPKIAIVANDTICQNGFMKFTGVIIKKDTSQLNYFWNFGNGESSNLLVPKTTQYRTPGIVTARFITLNSNGCSDTVLKAVTVNALPKTDAGADSIICKGATIQLNPTGADHYEWQLPASNISCFNCPNPFAKPDSSFMYKVKGISKEGCEKIDSIRIQVIQPSQVKASLPDSICLGESIRLYASGTQLYQWSPTNEINNPSSALPTARLSKTTMFVVTGSDAYNCFVTKDSVKISVFPIPQVNAGNDLSLPAGILYRLNANISPDVTSILWSPIENLSCSTCPAPFITPKTKTEYTIKVSNPAGCTNEDKITISVNCGTENIFIPNTFSPNGDGINDILYIRGTGATEINYFRIFNRWGQLVFERKALTTLNNPSAGWDGNLNGVQLPPDVYVYMADVKCDNGKTVTIKGDIMLVR